MALRVRRFSSLAALAELVPGIVYVMCGPRGEVRNRLTAALPNARFIGFEPDEKAHELLLAQSTARTHVVQTCRRRARGNPHSLFDALAGMLLAAQTKRQVLRLLHRLRPTG